MRTAKLGSLLPREPVASPVSWSCSAGGPCTLGVAGWRSARPLPVCREISQVKLFREETRFYCLGPSARLTRALNKDKGRIETGPWVCVRLGSWAQKILAIITSRFPKEKKPLGWLNAAWYSLGGFRGKCRTNGQMEALVLLVLPAPPSPHWGQSQGASAPAQLDVRTHPDSWQQDNRS